MMREPFLSTLKVANQKGVALLIVLWVLILLTVIVTQFAYSMRGEVEISKNFKEETLSYYKAKAGMNLALAEIMLYPRCVYLNVDGKLAPCGQATEEEAQRQAGAEPERTEAQAPHQLAVGASGYDYSVIDEESKLNLNFISKRTIDKLLELTGVKDANLRDIISDSILDWRDKDNAHRVNGAETDYYSGLPNPYRSKDGDFDSVEELGLVRGMTTEILYGNRRPGSQSDRRPAGGEEPDSYYGIYQYLTVFSSGRVNLNTASDIVLQVMGLNEEQARQIIETRPYRSFPTLASSVRGFTLIPTHFTIESEGKIGGGNIRRRVKAVVQKQYLAGGKGEMLLKYWDDNYIGRAHP